MNNISGLKVVAETKVGANPFGEPDYVKTIDQFGTETWENQGGFGLHKNKCDPTRMIERGEYFKNHRYFVKHTGKHHIIKAESREVGSINLHYQSAEARLRLPIGKKFSISAGAIFRTHERAYGYNPIEIWLNETEIALDPEGNPILDPDGRKHLHLGLKKQTFDQ